MKYLSVVSPLLICLTITLATPTTVAAQFVPQTEREQEAYLQGQLLYLSQLLAALQEVQELRTQLGVFSGVEVVTRRATNVEATTATLRGEVIAPAGERLEAWFEYDEDEDFLGNKTRQVRIDEAYDRAVSQDVRGLEEDERYYYRIVVQDNDGAVQYGSISQFRTDEDD